MITDGATTDAQQMTEHRIPIKKRTWGDKQGVVFSGMDALYVPSDDQEGIASEARSRFDIGSIDDGTVLGTVIASDEPQHHVVRIEWDDE